MSSCISTKRTVPQPTTAHDIKIEIEQAVDTTKIDSIRDDGWTTKIQVVDFSNGFNDIKLLEDLLTFNNYTKDNFTLNIDYIIDTDTTYEIDEVRDWFYKRDRKLDTLHRQYLVENTLTIMVFETGDLFSLTIGQDEGPINLGITPVLRNKELYQQWTPDFDVIYVTAEGLDNSNTLIHELGHYFGLGHVFDYNKEELMRLGIFNYGQLCRNYENYSCYTDTFTDEQVQQMIYNALAYRYYLFD